MPEYLKSLPQPIPSRIKALPVQDGMPVPWFTAVVGDKYDLRFVDKAKIIPALRHNTCWICGQKLDVYRSFNIGPVSAINLITSEPPSHKECAQWAAKACPHLNQKQRQRNNSNLPSELEDRNPLGISETIEVSCVATVTNYAIHPGKHLLIELKQVTDIEWLKHGVRATREEVVDALAKARSLIAEIAIQEGEKSLTKLESKYNKILTFLPK